MQWIFFFFILQCVVIDMLLESIERIILWVFIFNTLYLSLYLWGNGCAALHPSGFYSWGTQLFYIPNKQRVLEHLRILQGQPLQHFNCFFFCSWEAQKLKFGNQSCVNTNIFLKSNVWEFPARGLVKSKALKFLKVLKGHKKLITMIQAQE